VTDDILKKALDESVQKEMATLPNRQELDEMYPPSDILDKKIKKIIAKENPTIVPYVKLRGFSKIAALFAIMLVTGVAVVVNDRQNQFDAPISHAPTAPAAASVAPELAAPAPPAAPAPAMEMPRIAAAEVMEDEYDGAFARDITALDIATGEAEDANFGADAELWLAPSVYGSPLLEARGFYHVMTEYLDTMVVTTYHNAANDILMVVQNSTIQLSDAVNAVAVYGRDFSTIQVAGREVTLFDPIDFNQQVAMWETNGVVHHVIADVDMDEFVELLQAFFN